MRIPSTTPWAAVAALLLAACEVSTAPDDPLPGELRAEVAHGGGQAGTVGRALPDSVGVRVTRAGGAPAAGLPLRWRALDPGAEVLAASTHTDRDGRSGNVWVLGTTAGPQRLEVAAIVGGAAAVLDTLVAEAAPGPAVSLRTVGDSVRALVVGDTTRFVVEGVDAYGNAVPAARLGVRWSSLHPQVARVDGSGTVRAAALGDARLEARAGEARTRLYVRVDGVLESFLVADRTRAYVSRFVHGGGRTLAVSSTGYRTSVYHEVWEMEGGAWRGHGVGTVFQPTTVHVAPSGTAYARSGFLYVSPRPGTWTRDSSVVSRWARLAGSGSTLFGLRTTGYSWQEYSWIAERWEGGALADLALPAPYHRKSETDAQHALAAAGPRELYLATTAGTAWWDGQGWADVARPDGGGAFALRSLTAPAEGGPAYGLLGRNLLYRLGGGRAERVPNPLELTGETAQAVSVDAGGDPLLVAGGAVHFRIAGEWRQHRAPEGFVLQAAGWGAPGEVWMAVSRPTGGMDYYGSIHELRFQRLVVER